MMLKHVSEKDFKDVVSGNQDKEVFCKEFYKEVYAEIEKAVNEVNSRLPVYKRIKAWKIRKNDFLRTSLKKIIRTGVNIDE